MSLFEIIILVMCFLWVAVTVWSIFGSISWGFSATRCNGDCNQGRNCKCH